MLQFQAPYVVITHSELLNLMSQLYAHLRYQFSAVTFVVLKLVADINVVAYVCSMTY